MTKRFDFVIYLTGNGNTVEEAWKDAVDSFAIDPGEPGEVLHVEDEDEGFEGQDRENYTDTQDRENYVIEEN